MHMSIYIIKICDCTAVPYNYSLTIDGFTLRETVFFLKSKIESYRKIQNAYNLTSLKYILLKISNQRIVSKFKCLS